MNQTNGAPSPSSACELSAGLFMRGLTNLKGILTKGEAHAAATGRGEAALLDAKLATDMNDLRTQVHWAIEGAKLAIARLLGVAAPVPSANDASSLAELKQRIDAAIAHLGALAPRDLEAGLERVIEMHHRGASKQFNG